MRIKPRRKRNFRRTLICFFVSCYMLFIAGERQQLRGAETHAVDEAQAAERVKTLRKKYSDKKTWEKIVSFPGTVVSLPLVLFFKGQEAIIGYAFEEKGVLTSADGLRDVKPKFSNHLGAGVELYQRGIISPESQLSLTVTGTASGRQRYRVGFKAAEFFDGLLSSNLIIQHRYLPKESFFGIGSETEEANRSDFAYELTFGEVALDIKPLERFTIHTTLGLDQNGILSASTDERRSITGVYTKETLPGLETGVLIARMQLGLRYDSRNHPGNPTKGRQIVLSSGIFQELGDDRFDFWKLSADFRQYIHLFHNRALMVRVAGEMTEPFADHEIPFYDLSSLGRHETIRGFNHGRFRARDAILGSLEYRIPIWHSTDVVLFVDAGQVAGNIFEDLALDQFELGYGGGLRLWNAEKIFATLEFAASKERFRVYLCLN